MRTISRFAPLILLAGDVAAVIAFVAAGQRAHGLINEANPVLGVLLTGVEFAAPWVVAGWLLGAFRTGDPVAAGLAPAQGDGGHHGRPYVSFLARSLNTWLVAAPMGALIRSLALGRTVIPTMFLIAALGLGGAFVLGWRAVFALGWWWLNRKTSLKPAPGD